MMKRFQAKAELVLHEHGIDAAPTFSYDHAGPHDSANAIELMEQQGITQGEESRLLLPALSPDFHRVIEHVHAITAKAFNTQLRITEGRRNVEQYKKMYEAAFYKAVKASSVQEDIRGLKQLWEHVKAPTTEGGSDGDWPKTSML